MRVSSAPVAAAGAGTWREGQPGSGGPVVVGVLLHSLLPCLSGRFTAVRDLGSGGESDVLLVRDAAGQQWVVKQYRQRGWAPDADVLDVLADRRVGQTLTSWATDERTRHVVWLQEWGVDPATGLFFEVQEYLSEDALAGSGGGGSWSRLGEWPAEVLADAVLDAVAGFHATVGSAHRDLKPANLLVRSADPLVLVVADVGLSRNVGESSHRFSMRDGSPAYQAPEAAAQGKVSRAGDWWSVGMMVAEAAQGRHPLALSDGSLPDNLVVQTAMVEREIPLDGVTDPRLRMLCQGLLTRDSGLRWGWPQISDWRAGGSPMTGYGHTDPARTVTAPMAPARVRKVLFAGTDYDSPQGLAAAFAADPQRAGEVLFLAKDQTLLDDLRLMLQDSGLHEAQRIVSGYQSGAWQTVFLRFLVEMDPTLTPELAGQSMTPNATATVAQHVIATGQATDSQSGTLEWVTVHDLWRIWRQLPGMADAPAVAAALPAVDTVQAAWDKAGRRPAQWQTLVWDDSEQVKWSGNTSHPNGWDVLLPQQAVRGFIEQAQTLSAAWWVLLATHPDRTTRALNDAISHAKPKLRDQPWWQDLAASRAPVDRAVAVMTI